MGRQFQMAFVQLVGSFFNTLVSGTPKRCCCDLNLGCKGGFSKSKLQWSSVFFVWLWWWRTDIIANVNLGLNPGHNYSFGKAKLQWRSVFLIWPWWWGMAGFRHDAMRTLLMGHWFIATQRWWDIDGFMTLGPWRRQNHSARFAYSTRQVIWVSMRSSACCVGWNAQRCFCLYLKNQQRAPVWASWTHASVHGRARSYFWLMASALAHRQIQGRGQRAVPWRINRHTVGLTFGFLASRWAGCPRMYCAPPQMHTA